MSRRKTLLVDDSSQFFDSLKEWVKAKRYPFYVKDAYNFTEAALLLEENEIDVVLLNVHPTPLNQFELLYALRDLYPEVSIIILSKKHKHYYLRQLTKIYSAVLFKKKSHPNSRKNTAS